MSIKILGFAGSTRSESFNKRIVKIALAGAAKKGAETTFLDLKSLQMPLYDGDLEASSGLPETARTFRDALIAADGIIIASPEYNGAPSAVLKNAIDWSTRPDPESPHQPSLVAWKGKVAAMMSCSPGRLGGLRGLSHLRLILSGIGTLVLPTQVTVSAIHEELHEEGHLIDQKLHDQVEALGAELLRVTNAVRSE